MRNIGKNGDFMAETLISVECRRCGKKTKGKRKIKAVGFCSFKCKRLFEKETGKRIIRSRLNPTGYARDRGVYVFERDLNEAERPGEPDGRRNV